MTLKDYSKVCGVSGHISELLFRLPQKLQIVRLRMALSCSPIAALAQGKCWLWSGAQIFWLPESQLSCLHTCNPTCSLAEKCPERKRTMLPVHKSFRQYIKKFFLVIKYISLFFFLVKMDSSSCGDLCRNCTLCDLPCPLLIKLAYLGQVGIH